MRGLEDRDSEVVQMAKPGIVHLQTRRRGVAELKIHWQDRLGERLLFDQAGCYVLEYQRTWGVNGATAWRVVFRGKATSTTHDVHDDDDEFVSEHHYRIGARTALWASLWSEPNTFTLDLCAGGKESAHDAGRDEQRRRRLESQLTMTERGLRDAMDGSLGAEELSRLIRRLDSYARLMRPFGPHAPLRPACQ